MFNTCLLLDGYSTVLSGLINYLGGGRTTGADGAGGGVGRRWEATAAMIRGDRYGVPRMMVMVEQGI